MNRMLLRAVALIFFSAALGVCFLYRGLSGPKTLDAALGAAWLALAAWRIFDAVRMLKSHKEVGL